MKSIHEMRRTTVGRALAIVIVVAVLAIAARLRFSLPSAPFADADAWGYVGPTVLGAVEGGFPQVYARGFLYPTFLSLLLAIWGDFAAVTRVQHTIGLLGVVVFWATWHDARRLLPDTGWLRRAHDTIGVIAVCSYAFSDKLVMHEHMLRPESLFAAAACVMLWLTLQVLRRPVRSPGFLLLGAAHSGWLVVLYLLHPSFGFALLGGLLPPLVRVWIGTREWWRRLLPLAVLPAAFVLANAVQARVFSKLDVPGQIFGAMTVFAFNAENSIVAIEADLQSPASSPYPADLLQECARCIRLEFDTADRDGLRLPTMHYVPDHLIYDRRSVCNFVRHYFKQDADRIRGFFLHYALHGILLDPGRFLAKVGRGCDAAFGTEGWLMGALYERIDVAGELAGTRRNLDDYQAQWRRYAPCVALAQELANLPAVGSARAVPAMARLMRVFRPYYGLTLLALWSLTALLLRRRRRGTLAASGNALLVHAATVVGLSVFNLAITSTVAAVSSVGIGRYSDNQIAFTLFTFFASCAVALHALACVSGRPRPQPESSQS